MRGRSSRRSKSRERGTVACVALLTLAASACGSSSGRPGGDWAALSADGSNSRYQAKSTITGQNVARLQQQWMIHTNASVTSTPVVLDGNVYFADWSGNVYSAQVKTGTLNWKVNLGNPISSTPTIADGKVYVSVGPYDSRLHPPNTGNRVVALSESDGRRVWETGLPSTSRGAWASPILFDGTLFVGVAAGVGQSEDDASVGGTIFALRASTGKMVWTKELGGKAGGAGLWGSVAFDRDTGDIYFGTGNSYGHGDDTGDAFSIVSLDAKTGKQNWKYTNYQNEKLGRDYDFGSMPNIFEYKVAVGKDVKAIGLASKNGYYYVVAENDGKFLTQIQIRKDGGVNGIPGYLPGARGRATLIYVPTYRTAFDIASPQSCCGSLAAIDLISGTVKWSVTVQAEVVGSVALAPGVVVFGDNAGKLHALSTTTGATIVEKQLAASIESGVTLAEDHLFVTTSQGDPAFPDPTKPKSALGLYAFTA
jgi:outer membrane protein assembly factor BamB